MQEVRSRNRRRYEWYTSCLGTASSAEIPRTPRDSDNLTRFWRRGRAMWSTEAATAPQCGAAAAHARAPAFFDASSILCFLLQCITCTQRCCFSPRGLFPAIWEQAEGPCCDDLKMSSERQFAHVARVHLQQQVSKHSFV